MRDVPPLTPQKEEISLHEGSAGIRRLGLDDYDELLELWRRTGLHSLKRRGRDSRASLARQLASGVEIDDLMHRTNILRGRKHLRMWKVKARVQRNEDLGEPEGGVAAPLIDVLQRACLVWEREERVALSEFLDRALMGRDETLWSVAQSLSEILPDGDKQKQLLQRLLVSQDHLRDVARQEQLL